MINTFWSSYGSLFVNPLNGIEIGILISIIFVIPFYLAYKWISPNIVERVRLDGKVSILEKKFYWSLFIRYPLWGFIQQLLFVGIYVFLNSLWPDTALSYNMILASFIFMMAHIPNVFLMLLCFGFEFIILILMNEFHNIYLLGIVHGIIATCIGVFAPSVIITDYNISNAYALLFKKQTKENT